MEKRNPLIVGRMLDGILRDAGELLKQQIKENFVLTGWKDVARVFGLQDTHTMRRWARVYNLPCMRIGNRITVPLITVMEWYWNLWRSVHTEGGSDEYSRKMIENLSHVTSRRKKVNG